MIFHSRHDFYVDFLKTLYGLLEQLLPVSKELVALGLLAKLYELNDSFLKMRADATLLLKGGVLRKD